MPTVTGNRAYVRATSTVRAACWPTFVVPVMLVVCRPMSDRIVAVSVWPIEVLPFSPESSSQQTLDKAFLISNRPACTVLFLSVVSMLLETGRTTCKTNPGIYQLIRSLVYTVVASRHSGILFMIDFRAIVAPTVWLHVVVHVAQQFKLAASLAHEPNDK
jgi:hypothetical protein